MADHRSRFGRQPAHQLIARQRGDVALVAHKLGLRYTHLVCCLNGRYTPSWEVRKALSEYLGEPVEILFTPEALAATPGKPRAVWRVETDEAGGDRAGTR